MPARQCVAALALALVAAPVAAMDGAEFDYTLNCQGCHRADGSGTPGSVPALAGSVARFLRAPGGREYLGRVPGAAQAPVGDAALAAILNWMLSRFDPEHVPAGFAPYTAEEVGRLRRSPLTDVEGTRRALLETIERGK
jgi:mono/diheme cytochrome c family protein